MLVTAPANWSTPYGSPSPKDRTVVLWDVATGRSLAMINAQPFEYLKFQLSSNDRMLAVWSEPRPTGYFGMEFPSGSEVEVWDLTSGTRTTKLKHPRCFDITFLDAGQTLATFGASEEERDGESAWGLRLWDTATGSEKRELQDLQTVAAHPVFAPDGSRILACLAEDDVGIWEVASGKRTCVINVPPNRFAMGIGSPVALAAAFSADGRLVALDTWHEQALLVNADTGKIVHTLGEAIEPDFTTWPTAPYFTPDGNTLVTKGLKQGAMTIQLWDVETGEQRAAIEHVSESVMDDELMSSDGNLMIVGSAQGLALWNVGKGIRKSHSPIEGRWPQLNQDGTLLLSVCGDRKKLWDAKTGAELTVIGSSKLVKLSPDGKTAAAYNLGEGIIEIWDVDDLLEAAE
jgi:WD40 repeat protein